MNYRLDHDPPRELGLSGDAIVEGDWDFPDPLAGSPDIPCRFDLEPVAVSPDSVEWKGRERITPIDLETGGEVGDWGAEDPARVNPAEPRQQTPGAGPTGGLTAIDISGTDDQVGVIRCVDQAEQVG